MAPSETYLVKKGLKIQIQVFPLNTRFQVQLRELRLVILCFQISNQAYSKIVLVLEEWTAATQVWVRPTIDKLIIYTTEVYKKWTEWDILIRISYRLGTIATLAWLCQITMMNWHHMSIKWLRGYLIHIWVHRLLIFWSRKELRKVLLSNYIWSSLQITDKKMSNTSNILLINNYQGKIVWLW